MSSHNQLIARFSPEDRAEVVSASQPVSFSLGHCFAEPGDRPHHVYFVETGVVSAMALMSDGRTVESFMVGDEGLTATVSEIGIRQVQGRMVGQIAGSARRMESAHLSRLLQNSAAMRTVMVDYADRLIGELEQSTACNALHGAEARFAKWLLRCHDRVGTSDVLVLTQEFLASMLGSQRTTVNAAAQHLQQRGAIRYQRGKVHIVDRARLERLSCECYGRSSLRPPRPAVLSAA